MMAARLSRRSEGAIRAAGDAGIDAAGVDGVVDHPLQSVFAAAAIPSDATLLETPEAGGALVDGVVDVAVGNSLAEADDHVRFLMILVETESH
jgi:hypothetical protein